MDFKNFNFEKFKEVTATLGSGVLMFRLNEEKKAFIEYLNEKQCSYTLWNLKNYNLSEVGIFYSSILDMVLECLSYDYKKYYVEDFSDFISNEENVLSFIKEK